jgi:hypothetical protein
MKRCLDSRIFSLLGNTNPEINRWARIRTLIITPETVNGQRRDLVTVKRKLGGDGTHWREKSEYCGGLIYSELRQRLQRPLNLNL